MRAEKTQRSRAAKRTEAPVLRQSGVRVASPPPSDDREPQTRKGGRPLSPRRSSVTSQTSSQPRAQGTRRTKPARDSGVRGQVGSARERAGARRVPELRSLGRSLWGRPNPQDVDPDGRSANPGGRSANAGHRLRLGLPRCSRFSGSAPRSRPRRSKPRQRVSDAGPPTHEVDCESRFLLPTDPAKVPASDALGWPDLGVVPRGGRVSPPTRPRTRAGHDAPPSPAGGGGGPCGRAWE